MKKNLSAYHQTPVRKPAQIQKSRKIVQLVFASARNRRCPQQHSRGVQKARPEHPECSIPEAGAYQEKEAHARCLVQG